MRSLNEEQKAAVKASYESWMRADDAILDDGIKALDSFKAGMSPFDFNPEDFQKRQERITEVSSKRIELAQKSLEELKGITGDERIEKLNVFAAQHAADDPFAMQGDPEADPASPELAIRAGPAEEPGEIALEYNEVPQAIGVGTVQSLAGRMHLDDGKKAILETLHSDYVKKWDEELKPVADAARTAQQSMWNFEGGEGKPDRSKANLYFDKRREMLQMATAHDAAFFDDAQKAIGDDHARDLRLARLERTLQVIGGRPGSYTMFALGDRERTVNLPQVLREMQADDAERAKLEELLDARAEAMQKALAESAVEQLQLEQKMTDFQFVVQESYRGNDGGDSDASSRAMAAARDVGIKMMEVQQAMDRLAEKQAAALRTALDELLAALPESRREALQWAYDQAAYPQIFRDPRSAMPFIEKAQTFGDLTEAQRTQLQALHDSYRTDYMQHCRDMVPKQEPAAPGAKPEEQMMRQMERMNATAKVQFERDERSARAVSQLKRILTEEQSKRIAGLGDYEKNAPQGQGQFFAPD